MALIPQVVDAVTVPVIAAGGIADSRGIAAALMLGASGVQIGTAYLRCPEAKTSIAPSRRTGGRDRRRHRADQCPDRSSGPGHRQSCGPGAWPDEPGRTIVPGCCGRAGAAVLECQRLLPVHRVLVRTGRTSGPRHPGRGADANPGTRNPCAARRGISCPSRPQRCPPKQQRQDDAHADPPEPVDQKDQQPGTRRPASPNR